MWGLGFNIILPNMIIKKWGSVNQKTRPVWKEMEERLRICLKEPGIINGLDCQPDTLFKLFSEKLIYPKN